MAYADFLFSENQTLTGYLLATVSFPNESQACLFVMTITVNFPNNEFQLCLFDNQALNSKGEYNGGEWLDTTLHVSQTTRAFRVDVHPDRGGLNQNEDGIQIIIVEVRNSNADTLMRILLTYHYGDNPTTPGNSEEKIESDDIVDLSLYFKKSLLPYFLACFGSGVVIWGILTYLLKKRQEGIE